MYQVKENFISTLQNICFFVGDVVKEDELKYGCFKEDTVDFCDPSSFMDIELQRFPQVTVTITKKEHTNKWYITGGTIGCASDGLSPFDHETVAAYVLGLMGFDVPVVNRLVEDQDREPGAAPDGSYFIPNVGAAKGLLIVLKNHRLAVLWQLENDSDQQSVIGQHELDDTKEMFESYLWENMGLEPDGAVLSQGQLKVTDYGTPYRVDVYWLPILQIEVGIELMHCLHWEARISYVNDLSSIVKLPAENPFMDIINKELCDRGSILRIRKHPVIEGLYVVGLLRDQLVEGSVELTFSSQLQDFITLVYAAENMEIEFSSDLSRYWVKGNKQTNIS